MVGYKQMKKGGCILKKVRGFVLRKISGFIVTFLICLSLSWAQYGLGQNPVSSSAYSSNYIEHPVNPQKEGLGEMAGDLVSGPMELVRDMMSDICYIIGFSLLVIGLFQYRRYRHNPQEVPIGTPLTTLIVGTVLILLPFTYNLVQIMDS